MSAAIGTKRVCSFWGYVFIKTPKGWVREHRFVWEKYRGAIPKGMVVHHKDENKLNNKIRNLELLTRGEHQRLHNVGAVRAAVVKVNMSTSAKKRNADPAYKKMISERAKKQHAAGKLGAATWTEESKRRISEKMSLCMVEITKKRWEDPEYRAKTQKAMKNSWTPERRAKQAEYARIVANKLWEKQRGNKSS